MTKRSIIPWALVLAVVAQAACGDHDPLGPVTGHDGTPITPAAADDGLGIGVPNPWEACPDRPQDLVHGPYGVRLRTVTIHDPIRDIDKPVDVLVPVDPITRPLVFGGGPYSVIVFSHGALPYDPTKFTVDFEPMFPEFTHYWATRGYIVIAPRHHHFPDNPTKNQDWRTRDVTFALDKVRELVRTVDPYAFVDVRNPILSGFSSGTTTAALLLGARHESGALRNADYRDPRFGAGIFLAGYATYLIGHDLETDFSRMTMPLLSLVGADDFFNEPPNVPEDFLGIVRDSPPGAKHGVLVEGAGHWLGARPWRGDAPGTLEVSQTATMLFLRAYTRPPNSPAVATLADNNFCGLVSNSDVQVERHEPMPPVELDTPERPRTPDPRPERPTRQWH